MIAALAMLPVLAGDASAAGTKGASYVLDIGRTGPAGITKISPKGSTSKVPRINGPGVEPSGLIDPVGIVVDSKGFLVVADSNGYNDQNLPGWASSPQDCGGGCGAILRIDPKNGTTRVLSVGPLTSNPYGVLLPPDGNITDGKNDYVLVADSAEGPIKVDLSKPFNNRQSYFPGPTQRQSPLFRGTWDIVRDISKKNRGDLLISMASSGAALGESADTLGKSVPPACENHRAGYVVRLSRRGGTKRYYCDPRIVAPRGLEVAYDGTVYVSDPFAFAGGQDFGALFEIAPRGGRIEPRSTGELFSTPSGLAFDFKGTSLLVADETAPGFGSPRGGVVRVLANDGLQTKLTRLGGNPIDIAVDRRGQRLPLQPKPGRKPQPERVPLYTTDYDPARYTNDDVVQGGAENPTGLKIVPIDGLRVGTRVLFKCLNKACKSANNSNQAVNRSRRVTFGGFGKKGLRGKFRLINWQPGGTSGGKRYRGRIRDYKVRFDFNGSPIFVHGTRTCLLRPGKKKVNKRNTGFCRRIIGGGA